MQVDALIFDFDGLILDTETPDFEILGGLYGEYGATLALEQWMTGLGTHGAYDPYAELLAVAGTTLDRDELALLHRRRYREKVEQQPLQPGIRELLATGRAAGMRLAVASSSDYAWVSGWLRHHQLDRAFDCIRTRNDVAHVKPAPDLFLAAAECLDVSPARCVVFEDSPNGMRAAAAAGMRCVAVPIPLLAERELPPVTLRLPSLAVVTPKELLQQLALIPAPSAR